MSDWYRWSDTNQTSITDHEFEVFAVGLAVPGGLAGAAPRPLSPRARSSDAAGGARVGDLGVGHDVHQVGHARGERAAQRRPDASGLGDQLPGPAQGGDD